MIVPLTPAVYKLKYDKEKSFRLEYFRNNYIIEGKTYGKTTDYVNHFWNSYISGTGNMGVMLTGEAGSGKSRCCEMLANYAIANNMCAVIITNVGSIEGIVEFINGLHNMVIIFDEFGKYFSLKTQQKMLAMFSVKTDLRKLFVITENNIRGVNQYIRCRPGRVRYAIDFRRLEEVVLHEYCKDMCVEEPMKGDIMKLWAKAPSFTFDHLNAIVMEHLKYTELTFDDIMTLLNLDELIITRMYKPYKVINMADSTKEYTIDSGRPIDKDQLTTFLKYFDRSVCFREVVAKDDSNPPDTHRVSINMSNFKEIDPDMNHVFETDGFRILINEAS